MPPLCKGRRPEGAEGLFFLQQPDLIPPILQSADADSSLSARELFARQQLVKPSLWGTGDRRPPQGYKAAVDEGSKKRRRRTIDPSVFYVIS